VHAYFAIDWKIVWSAAIEDVPALRSQIAEVLLEISAQDR
jgi:uncharacterized protein with HEPN domain